MNLNANKDKHTLQPVLRHHLYILNKQGKYIYICFHILVNILFDLACVRIIKYLLKHIKKSLLYRKYTVVKYSIYAYEARFYYFFFLRS